MLCQLRFESEHVSESRRLTTPTMVMVAMTSFGELVFFLKRRQFQKYKSSFRKYFGFLLLKKMNDCLCQGGHIFVHLKPNILVLSTFIGIFEIFTKLWAFQIQFELIVAAFFSQLGLKPFNTRPCLFKGAFTLVHFT